MTITMTFFKLLAVGTKRDASMFVYFLGSIDTSLQGFILRLGELVDRSS